MNTFKLKLSWCSRKTEAAGGKQKVCVKSTEGDELFYGGHY